VNHQLLTKSLCAFLDQIHHPQYGLQQSTFGVPGFGSIIQTVNTTTPISPLGSGSPRTEVAMPDQDKAMGAWIPTGIPGTQLGPNKDGWKW